MANQGTVLDYVRPALIVRNAQNNETLINMIKNNYTQICIFTLLKVPSKMRDMSLKTPSLMSLKTPSPKQRLCFFFGVKFSTMLQKVQKV